MRYQIIVGNVGTVADTDNEDEAIRVFHGNTTISSSGTGRAGHESVVLMRDGEPWVEFTPEST